jgi:hypothetical protein
MATVTKIIDDMDGSDADETVSFSVDGVAYEIDLSTANADRLRDVLGEFISAARRTGGRLKRGRPAAVATQAGAADGFDTARERNRAVREWARARGIDVPGRGRLSSRVLEMWENRDKDKGNPEVIGKQPVGKGTVTPFRVAGENGKVNGSRARSTSPRRRPKSGSGGTTVQP